MTTDNDLKPMTKSRCEERLAHGGVGRVAISDELGPVIFPVNFAYNGTHVVFFTAEGRKAASAKAKARFAFEIDGFDEVYQRGWSVLVTGRAEVVDDIAASDRYAMLPLRPWVGGDTPLCIRIRADSVTGREVRPDQWV